MAYDDTPVLRTLSTPRLDELARTLDDMIPRATADTARTLVLMLGALDKERGRRAAVIERRGTWT